MDQALKQWLTRRKIAEGVVNTKIWISRERKEIFRWNKNISSMVFEGLSFGEKIKKKKNVCCKSKYTKKVWYSFDIDLSFYIPWFY